MDLNIIKMLKPIIKQHFGVHNKISVACFQVFIFKIKTKISYFEKVDYNKHHNSDRRSLRHNIVWGNGVYLFIFS